MNRIIYMLIILVLISSCDISGVKNTEKIDTDTIHNLSSTDSAFVNLKTAVTPIKVDSVKNEEGLAMVWNRDDGLRVEWKTRKLDQQINKNDLILANYEARVARGEVYDHNREAGKPLPLKLGVGQLIAGWEAALLEMSVGDIARIMIPSKLAYGENGYLGKIPKNADIIVEIEITDKIDPQVLQEGVKVYKYKSGDSLNTTPVKNQKVTFDYFTYKKGKQPGMYDNSYAKGQPFTMIFENDNLVDGLHQGMAVLRAGDNAFVEVPSALAYGKAGLANLVPPNTDIVFDLRIESIK
ncbi:MAG: FKBP-type peptidyl-prolyl cis-trans isomerase [Crocinitomicaceae bacterium]